MGRLRRPFHKKRTTPAAKIDIDDNKISFNKEATCWLGVWLESQLTLKENHAIRLKKGKNAMNRLRRLIGQMGLRQSTAERL
jgi:hypothetical protein